MEPLKVILIGKFIQGKLVVYETQLNDHITAALTNFNREDDPLASPFSIPCLIGEGKHRRKFTLDLFFPFLKEITSTRKVENVAEFLACRLAIPADIERYQGQLWCLTEDLVWVNRPSRSREDYEYIKLKVEEFILEKKDEYTTLVRKVERLRKILDKEFHGSREFPTDDVLAFVMKRDGGKCALCDSQETLQFDHIYPKSKGGNDEPENLRILCRACNSKRGNLDRRA